MDIDPCIGKLGENWKLLKPPRPGLLDDRMFSSGGRVLRRRMQQRPSIGGSQVDLRYHGGVSLPRPPPFRPLPVRSLAPIQTMRGAAAVCIPAG